MLALLMLIGGGTLAASPDSPVVMPSFVSVEYGDRDSRKKAPGILVKAVDDIGYVLCGKRLKTGDEITCRYIGRGGEPQWARSDEVVQAGEVYIIRVTGPDLPEPFPWQSGSLAEPDQRLSVLLVYQSGKDSSIRAFGARTTVAKPAVDGYFEASGVDRSVYPAEPVTDAAGKLAGLTVSSLPQGKPIKILSYAAIRSAIGGEASDMNMDLSPPDGGKVRFQFHATLNDPLRMVESAELLVIAKSRLSDEAGRRNKEGCFEAIPRPSQVFPLRVLQGQVTGAGELGPLWIEGDAYCFQVRVTCANSPMGEVYSRIEQADNPGGLAGAGPGGDAEGDDGSYVHVSHKRTVIPIDQFLEEPAALRDILLAAGGEFLVLRLAGQGEAYIFDPQVRKVTKQIFVGEHSALAATRDLLIAVDPVAGEMRTWSGNDFKPSARARPVSPKLGIARAAAPFDAVGPLMINGIETMFLDPRSSQPLVPALEPNLRSDVPGLILWRQRLRRAHLHASPNGSIFLIVESGQANALRNQNGTWVEERISNVGYCLPSRDGQLIFTAYGTYTPDLQTKVDVNALLPTPSHDHVLQILDLAPVTKSASLHWPQRLAILEASTRRILDETPELTEMSGVWDPSEDPVEFGARYQLFPDAGILVTIPPHGNKLVMRPMTWHSNDGGPLDAALEIKRIMKSPPRADKKSDKKPVAKPDTKADAKAGESTADAMTRRMKFRTWADRTGSYKVKAAFVSYDGNEITLRKEDGTTITVALDKLSPMDVQYVRGLTKQREDAVNGSTR